MFEFCKEVIYLSMDIFSELKKWINLFWMIREYILSVYCVFFILYVVYSYLMIKIWFVM